YYHVGATKEKTRLIKPRHGSVAIHHGPQTDRRGVPEDHSENVVVVVEPPFRGTAYQDDGVSGRCRVGQPRAEPHREQLHVEEMTPPARRAFRHVQDVRLHVPGHQARPVDAELRQERDGETIDLLHVNPDARVAFQKRQVKRYPWKVFHDEVKKSKPPKLGYRQYFVVTGI
ncbi:hypothetical protein LSAT2_018205, partial [Lamellibrachia satsuma]